MAMRDIFGKLGEQRPGNSFRTNARAPDGAPLGGSRSEAMQRLQVGVTGLCAMVLVVGIASVIGGQADIAEEAAVPDAAPTTEPTAAPPQRDPLADAGVVPDIPAPAETASAETAPAEGASERVVPDIEGRVRVPDTPRAKPQGQPDGS